jgi:hypothetical protein
MDEKRSLENLLVRRKIAQAAIGTLDKAQDDPRQPEAISRIKLQLKSIDAQITELTGKPPAITVGLNTASLTGDATRKG